MRAAPLPPAEMNPEVRYVHDEVVNLVTRSQGPVSMVNPEGALIGPFPPMLRHPQFGIPALAFIRSLDNHATLPKKLKEVAILTVGAVFGSRFELYAHKIMAEHFGFSKTAVAYLASGYRPAELDEAESLAYQVANTLANGSTLSDSLYTRSIEVLGEEGTAELIFLIAGYAMLAMVLNGFDVPIPKDQTK
ncbi:carboxymuconolactone decarboxylase family protein [Flavobacterium sp.]|uniref:carboxymuconolactone decarboxylase family protein n=1 Tax=Flavobacterium sp. TaxID=239 RepID=UPI0039E3CB57